MIYVLFADHYNKSKVDAIPFSFIACHMFNTGYALDTALSLRRLVGSVSRVRLSISGL